MAILVKQNGCGEDQVSKPNAELSSVEEQKAKLQTDIDMQTNQGRDDGQS